MKYRYHVYTPFSRKQNFTRLLNMLRPTGVTWHLVCEFEEIPAAPLGTEWAKLMLCDHFPEGWFAGSYKKNWFLNHVEWDHEARYIMLNDDDLYEPGFFEKMDDQDGEFLICSMKRGDQCPSDSKNPQACHTLVADKANLFCGGVADEQVMLSGRLLRRYRFGREYAGDWSLIKDVLAQHAPAMVPGAFVWFNYLEPGRWNEVKL